MKCFEDTMQLIGNTPLVRLKRIEEKYGLKVKLYAKAEMFNLAGSAKDRIAKAMIEEASNTGKIKEGATLIEATSGNTGIGLACVAAMKGYKLILTMPDTMSVERISLLEAYGAKIVLTSGNLGMKGALDKAKELNAQIENSFIVSQFENEANPKAHYETTGPEIYEALDGKLDIFVCSVGTGGSISGTGKYLKSKNPSISVIAVEPKNSPLLSKGVVGSHKIQGIGANFIPNTLDRKVYDEILTVSDEKAFEMSKMLVREEGLLAGISSGAALSSAIEVASRVENEGKTMVVLLPDRGERYLSTNIYK